MACLLYNARSSVLIYYVFLHILGYVMIEKRTDDIAKIGGNERQQTEKKGEYAQIWVQ